jgi:cardiolipin synthase
MVGRPTKAKMVPLGKASLFVAASLLAAGCATAATGGGRSKPAAPTSQIETSTTAEAPTAPSIPPPTTTTPTTPPSPSALSLLVEPVDGMSSLYSFMASAAHTLDMTMYELSDPTAEQALIADAHRGVAVRVLLDKDFSGGTVNQNAFTALANGGVMVRWTNSSEIFHQKTVTVDTTRSAIMTGNLTPQYYATTRDFVVMDSQAADVSGIESVFDHDWAGAAPAPGFGGIDLVWSPGSAPQLVSLINSATRTLGVENEEMDSATIEDALEADARRGVDVTVTMTADSEWDSAFSQLEAAGVHVVLYADSSSALYIHAKVIDVDSTRAFVGSENFSTASLNYNRELGLVTSSASVLSRLNATLASDAAGGRSQAPTTAPPAAPVVVPTAPASATATTAGCYIDPEGNCYKAGEYCPDRLHGQTVQGQVGPLTCEDRGAWYWETS